MRSSRVVPSYETNPDSFAFRAAMLRPRNRPKRGTIVTALLTSLRVVIIGGLVLLTLRLLVLVSEAHAMIRTERTADDELVELCNVGAARESPHMRQACMRAVTSRASPILFQALTRGAYAFMDELYGMVTAPLHAVGLASAVASAVGVMGLLPWTSTLRSMLSAVRQDSHRDSLQPEHTVVILQNGERAVPLTNGSLINRRSKPELRYHDEEL